MPIYILLTRIKSMLPQDAEFYLVLNDTVKEEIAERCPNVTWVSNFAVSGPYDYLDVFTAPDNDTATEVSLIVRSRGNAETEVWNATRWEKFKTIIQGNFEFAAEGSREAQGAETGNADRKSDHSKSDHNKSDRPQQASRQDKRPISPVDEAGRESFPASDPPSWTATRG